ncbi:AMP-binding protein [Gordonia pseudamarae]|uniref:AMP-binding protein n=1 Tax=Gordonia pseudamarae TaxID=2831662 RepID=A0ABX6IDS4_9ACTN|nr:MULTISPECIES: class I adenylate-forming enzyme family protein [Gordonia]MBD0022375.1 acyl--CoA ligase [Gordonia sp. (in: high G+C Gram-positive bacteria)]QHN25073.1 AMP-binding protein [Gordonia pseudamarae]QHN34007.1 AMP-binding protein [Gordonia pseudamarae]
MNAPTAPRASTAPRAVRRTARKLTVDALIRDAAKQFSGKEAVIDPGERLTYRRLDTSTLELAAVLVDAGIGIGTRVSLLMPNSARWVQLSLALTRIGAVLVPLSTLLKARELHAQLATARVEVLITVEEFRGHRYLDALAEWLDRESLPTGGERLLEPELPALRSAWTPDELFAAAHPVATEAGESPATRLAPVVDALGAAVTPADHLVTIFTSGSSGTPKGVNHSHESALFAVQSGQEARRVGPDSRLYLPMPFFWVGGFGAGILSALSAGATLVTEEMPTAESTLNLIVSERITLFRGWPDQAVSVAALAAETGADLSSIADGSLPALLPPELRPAPGTRANIFGMTESFGPYCGYRADLNMPESARGSCGKPFPGIEVRIADKVTGTPLGPGEPGEIQLRGRRILQGICGRTREDVFTADGFYPTGDLGQFDDDGFLFYLGRSDDMFKVSGATVYPSEVQAALRAIDGVDAAFVTSVPGPNGPRVGAAVVSTSGVTPESLRSSAKNLLSSFKVPSVWLVVSSADEIPRGGTGKVLANDLRDLLIAAE